MSNTVAPDNAYPPLTTSEIAMITAWKTHKKNNGSLMSYAITANGELSLKTRDQRGNKEEQASLKQIAWYSATGAINEDFSRLVFGLSFAASGLKDSDSIKGNIDEMNALLNALTALKPADEIEGMLISRLIPLHFQSMHYLASSADASAHPQAIDININRAAKLMRLHNETLETLMRYRRKGEQKVLVQHVQVNDGGKAVVTGKIETSPGA